jgi:transposase
MMLQLTPQSRVFVAIEPADFRRGIDGLTALCPQRLREDPGPANLRLVTQQARRVLFGVYRISSFNRIDRRKICIRILVGARMPTRY